MTQVLYISYDGMTDQLGQSQVLPYIIELTKKGFQFSLISCEKQEKFHQNKHIISKICLENNIDWHPVSYHKSPPVLSTIWDVFKLQKLAIKLHHQKKFSIIHCRSYIASLIGLKLKRKYGIKFLFDMRGLWADEKVDAGAWNLNQPIFKKVYLFFKKKEKEFLIHADHIISLTQNGKQELISWNVHESVKNKITVIPCCVDTKLFNPELVFSSCKLKWMNKLSIDEKHQVICYLGSIGTWYMLDEMLDFYTVWREGKPKPKFLFITHDEHDKIIFKAKEKNIADEIILQPATRNEIPTLLSLAQLSVFFIRPTYSKISSSPTKLAEIMAMGIPIICNSGIGDTDKIISQFNSGCLVKEFNSNSYRKIIKNFNNIKFEPNKIREKSQLNFDVNVATDIYLKIYNKLINQD